MILASASTAPSSTSCRTSSRPARRRSRPRSGSAPRSTTSQALGLDNIAAHEAELLAYATRALQQVPGLRIVGTARAEVQRHVLRAWTRLHPHDVGTLLDLDGIAVRTGHHCALPVIERLGHSATTRASLGALQHRRTRSTRWSRACAEIAWRCSEPLTGGQLMSDDASLERATEFLSDDSADKAPPARGRRARRARDRGAAHGLRPGDPGQHLRARPDLQGRHRRRPRTSTST